ncbi:MAG: NAD(P)H dehydrogenase (quinone) [Myxococcota bacterium]|jgi:NAD(P)H dehydrogenase (quinone)
MRYPTILVTGSTGKTGKYVVEQLRERGFPVRALARKYDERTEHLESIGAQVVLGDFLDLSSMRAAVRGTQRVYFCYPPNVGRLVEATSIMAEAAEAEGVEVVVNVSQISAREDSLSPVARQHWLSERVLDWANVGAAHLRPTFFAEMLVILGAASISNEDTLLLPFGEGRHAPVAAADIARVATAILADPTGHIGERYVVTGPLNMTVTEMAAVVSGELGRTVTYVQPPREVWAQALEVQGGLPAVLVKHLVAVAGDHQNGVFSAQTDIVERIGGQKPQSLGGYIRENLAQFTPREAHRA